jgi:antitoxin ChpS
MSDTKIQKWGNSMALRIPAVTMRAWGIAEGQTVALQVEAGALVVRPAQKRYTLAELLAQCDFSKPKRAVDREWLDAPPVGLEDI